MKNFFVNDPDNPREEAPAVSSELIVGTSFAFQFENGRISHRLIIPVVFA